MSGKKPYFDNNWQLYKDARDEDFIPHTFEDFMLWKGEAWDLPATVNCIIRVSNRKTGRVKEHTYRKQSAAIARLQKLIEDDDIDILVCRQESMHLITPQLLDQDDNEQLDYDLWDSEETI